MHKSASFEVLKIKVVKNDNCTYYSQYLSVPKMLGPTVIALDPPAPQQDPKTWGKLDLKKAESTLMAELTKLRQTLEILDMFWEEGHFPLPLVNK